MTVSGTSGRSLRTGIFEIDLGTGELYKNGRKFPLQEQPFRVLAVLLERPGELVSREELQARLWPADTFVSFDEGINTAIRKLRLAFGDSADNPRFIETVPRRGYRFIAPVSERSEAKISDRLPEASPAREARAERASSRLLQWLLGNGSNVARKIGVAAISAVLLAVIAYVVYAGHVTNSPPKRAMLAVLPFQNLSSDSGQEYFSDGLTEETITDLGQLSPAHLGVIARTSAMAYKHTDKTVSQIGHELGVDYILEGSVRRDGGQARISAQLIRVSDQTHLWAQNYDRQLHDILEIENELGKTIAQQVQIKLTPLRETELAKMRTLDPDAYDLYLRGRFYWNQRTPAGINQSIAYFRQAIAKDSDFALAYAGLADAYNLGNIVGSYSPKESFPEAREAAAKAIALDPALAEAHAALGMEKSHYEFDFPGAEREFLKAIEVNPNSAYAHLFYSNCYLMPMGRKAEAIAENKKALELDPLSLPINNFMAMTYLFAEDYESSYRQFRHTIEMDPTFPLAHDYFSALLLITGRYEEGIREHQKSQVLSGSNPEDADAEAAASLKAFKQGGEKGFWRWNLQATLKALKRPTGQAASASAVASAYAMAGDKDKAFEWLDRAYDERDGQDISLLKVDPSYKNLRSDPRFAAMLRRLGLPE